MKIPLPLSSRRLTSPAFTLIELLTVIAVIGILAAILIPVVGGARRSAMAAKSRYEFTQLANACQSFKADYGWWPMEGSTNPVSTEDSNIIAILSGNQSDYQGARKLNRRDSKSRIRKLNSSTKHLLYSIIYVYIYMSLMSKES